MTFYRCDPTKNRFCQKRDCFIHGGICTLTSNIRASEDGKPIEDIAGGGLTGKQKALKEGKDGLL